MAQARWKSFDLNHMRPNAIAQKAQARIAARYDIERRGREMSVADRAAQRGRAAVPLSVYNPLPC